jgi:hypothetical protein
MLSQALGLTPFMCCEREEYEPKPLGSYVIATRENRLADFRKSPRSVCRLTLFIYVANMHII